MKFEESPQPDPVEKERQNETFNIKRLQSKVFEEAEKIEIGTENRDSEGNLLVFPGGPKSNLKEQDWKIVRTESFKNWFGNWQEKEPCSVIVDENGEPKILTHRTDNESIDLLPARKDFSVTSRFMHFTSKWEGVKPTWRYGKNIHFAFLNIRKLFNGGAGGMSYYDYPNSEKAGFVHDIDDDFLNYLLNKKYDGAYASGTKRVNYLGPLMYTDECVVLNPELQVLLVGRQADTD